MAAWSPEQFIDRVLVDCLHAAAVVVGANFRFGSRASGDVATLREAGESRDFVAEGVPLDGGPQVWSSTYVRTCLATGDVAGAAEALGRPFTVRGAGRARRQARPRARLPDRQRADQRRVRRPGRRRVRRVAAADGHRRDLPGRDQRRHQPDLRRRARAPGGELRAGPRRPRAVRRRGRGGLRRPPARDGGVRVGREAGRADARRRRPGPRAAGAREGCHRRAVGRHRGVVPPARAAVLRSRGAARPRAAGCGSAGRSRWCCSSAWSAAGAGWRAGAGQRRVQLRSRRRWSPSAWSRRSGTPSTALRGATDRHLGAAPHVRQPPDPAADDDPRASAAAAVRDVPVHQRRGLGGRGQARRR